MTTCSPYSRVPGYTHLTNIVSRHSLGPPSYYNRTHWPTVIIHGPYGPRHMVQNAILLPTNRFSAPKRGKKKKKKERAGHLADRPRIQIDCSRDKLNFVPRRSRNCALLGDDATGRRNITLCGLETYTTSKFTDETERRKQNHPSHLITRFIFHHFVINGGDRLPKPPPKPYSTFNLCNIHKIRYNLRNFFFIFLICTIRRRSY